jgi:four helix bundle protein
MPFKFEKLKVWQKGLDLSDRIHQVSKTFPTDGLYILTSQIKRAADSVVLNIAEGSTGQSNGEFKKFISYAIRSNVEVVACLYLAKKRNYLPEKDFDMLYRNCEEILIMLYALKKTL